MWLFNVSTTWVAGLVVLCGVWRGEGADLSGPGLLYPEHRCLCILAWTCHWCRSPEPLSSPDHMLAPWYFALALLWMLWYPEGMICGDHRWWCQGIFDIWRCRQFDQHWLIPGHIIHKIILSIILDTSFCNRHCSIVCRSTHYVLFSICLSEFTVF